MLFAAVHESVAGTKRTLGDVRCLVANGGKRTWRLCSPTSEFDPQETSAISNATYPRRATGASCLSRIIRPKALEELPALSALWGQLARAPVPFREPGGLSGCLLNAYLLKNSICCVHE
jgi:hypothetical protein